jgi:hypothetical protein
VVTGQLARDFWLLRDDPAADPDELAAVAAAEVIRHASGAARKIMERDRLMRLRDIVALGQHGRGAEEAVRAALSRYKRGGWRPDQERGYSAGAAPIDSLCFEILTLSGGKPSSRKLQAIFSASAQKS